MRIAFALVATAVLLGVVGQAHAQAQFGGPLPREPRPQMPVAPPPSISSMALSHDGKIIAIGYSQKGYMSGGVELVSTKTGRGPGVLLNYSPRQETVLIPSALAFSPDGSRIAVGGNQGRVAIWDATKTGNELFYFEALQDFMTAQRKDVLALAYFPDGKSLVTITGDGFLKRWDAVNGKMLTSLMLGKISLVALSRDGKLAVSAHENNMVHVWQTELGTAAKSFNIPKLQSLALSPDGKAIVVGYKIKWLNGMDTIKPKGEDFVEASKTMVLDVKTGEQLRKFDWAATDAQFSPSGKMLVTCDSSGPIRIWDIQSGKNALTWTNEIGYQQVIASQDGIHLIGRQQSGVSAWNVMTGERIIGR